MLHVKNRQNLNFHFDVLVVSVFHTVVFFTLICSCGAQPQLIGSSQPIVAVVGDDIILPCHLQPAEDASDLTVEWTRPDLDPRFVHVLHDGEELQSLQHPSYRERTSLFTDELKNGNISLKLSKVKPADEGKYRCFIPEITRDSTVQLVVDDLFNIPSSSSSVAVTVGVSLTVCIVFLLLFVLFLWKKTNIISKS
ncbi:myelin-oligodendrocyte glycoprotein-like [Anabas testudineus]|uniref:Ig-like domain-containing protein n=1 Tax=Anabas testudineus TaxID=64144 RepID=A0A3Q1IDS1_ANATE|nr:myelin-oligodendrocyte glycoprotein-like [Anabas testudineus]